MKNNCKKKTIKKSDKLEHREWPQNINNRLIDTENGYMGIGKYYISEPEQK